MAAYINILRRDLNTTCITSNRGCDVTAVEPIRGGLMDMEAFWSKPSVKVVIKITQKVVSTCEVLWSAHLNTSKVTGNWQDRSSQRSYEQIRGVFNSEGGWRPQRSISTMVDGNCSISHLHQCPVYGTGQQWSKRWSTLQHLADGWSRLKTEVDYEVESAQLLAFARLQSLV